MVRISFCDPSSQPQAWLDGLRAHLPGMVVENWSDGDAPADYAVAWAPPQRFIDQQTRLRALFNVGAGVDKLLRLQLPPGLRVIRLDDAGMGVQMAEYVCHAVSRHFREFAAYEAQARARPVGAAHAAVAERSLPSAFWAWACWASGWRRLAAVRVSGHGLEPQRPARATASAALPARQGLPDFLARSQALVCLLPLTPDTRDILGRETLSQLACRRLCGQRGARRACGGR